MPRSVDAARAVAELRAECEARLVDAPDDYAALVTLGELKLRVGLAGEARELLQQASLLRPPSWVAYQRTSALLRRAEMHAEHAFPRPAGAGLPGARLLAAAAQRLSALAARRGTA
jgi:hypothetical protein